MVGPHELKPTAKKLSFEQDLVRAALERILTPEEMTFRRVPIKTAKAPRANAKHSPENEEEARALQQEKFLISKGWVKTGVTIEKPYSPAVVQKTWWIKNGRELPQWLACWLEEKKIPFTKKEVKAKAAQC